MNLHISEELTIDEDTEIKFSICENGKDRSVITVFDDFYSLSKEDKSGILDLVQEWIDRQRIKITGKDEKVEKIKKALSLFYQDDGWEDGIKILCDLAGVKCTLDDLGIEEISICDVLKQK